MDGFSVSSSISPEDWQAYLRATALRSSPLQTRNLFPGLIVSSLLVGGGAAWWTGSGRHFHFPSMVVGFLIVLIQTAVSTFLARSRTAPSENGAFLGPRETVLSANGVQVRRSGSLFSAEWQAVQDVTRTPDHIFIWMDRLAGYPIPIRDLPPDQSPDQITSRLRRWIEAAKGSKAPGEQLGVQFEAREENAKRNTFTALLRLSVLRRIPGLALRASDWKIALLAGLVLLEFAVLDHMTTGAGAKFSLFGLAGIAAYVLAGLSLAWVLSRLSQPSVAYKDALLLVLGWSLVIICASTVLDEYLRFGSGYLGGSLLLLYSLAYFRVGLRSLVGVVQPAALLGAGLILVGFSWFASRTYLSPGLWTLPDDDSVAVYRESAARAEEVMFGQPAAVDAQLSHIAPAGDSASKVYFVGFAGVGSQKVFTEEIHLAQQRVGDRYGSADRSAVLINDVRNLDQAPLASFSGLRRTLAGIGNKMHRDRDVLFLALSSHGSAKPTLSVSNGALPLIGLSGELLKQALAESGIQWKVIVISACHAGAFIPALKDDHTIVITAAAADRTSFGCSNDRDLTYFGEAFYRDALPQAKSLREAFDKAKDFIAQRERAEKLDASMPTAFFGSAMEAKMTELEVSRLSER